MNISCVLFKLSKDYEDMMLLKTVKKPMVYVVKVGINLWSNNLAIDVNICTERLILNQTEITSNGTLEP